MSDFFEDFSDLNDNWVDPKDLELKNSALANPEIDYFLQSKPEQPKYTVGKYVLEQGFPVPLLAGADDVASSVDDGTLMIRSELQQDYAGLGGIFSSYVLEWAFSNERTDYQKQFNDLIKGLLRNGELSPQEYMERLLPYNNWMQARVKLLEEALGLGLTEMPINLGISASLWRYIEGTNVTMFKDPHVDGRYHFGVSPKGQSVGDYRIEKGEHSTAQTFRKHRQPFVAEPFIDIYEQIRSLPLFDNRQAPVMELQQALDGTIYFLQYRHVDKQIAITDPFELPRDGFRTDSVRGITPPEGTRVKLEINPSINKKVPGRGLYGDTFYFSDYTPLKTQIACKLAEVALCEDWLSLKNNHTSTANLILPRLAIGLYGANEKSLPMIKFFEDLPRDLSSLGGQTNGEYFDVHVTSNGHEAVLQSDWVIRKY